MKYQEFCETLAQEAGAIMKEHFRGDLQTTYKKDNSPLTIADTKINSLVIQRIREQFPEHSIYGEEESHIQNNSKYLWVCDPIDGTIPYSNAIPTATFSLALTYEGKPIAGILHDPWMERSYYAEENCGIYLNGKKITEENKFAPGKTLVGITAWKEAPYNLVKTFEIITNKGYLAMRIPSITYMGMLIASGEVAGILFPGDGAYDAAALDIIIREAGGKTSDIFGRAQLYNNKIKGFIGAKKEFYNELLEVAQQLMSKEN